MIETTTIQQAKERHWSIQLIGFVASEGFKPIDIFGMILFLLAVALGLTEVTEETK